MQKALLVFLCFFSLSVFAQNKDAKLPSEVLQSKKKGEGSVMVHEEDGISFLLRTHIEMNERTKFVDGYRIQLYSGSGPKAKQEALQVKGRVLELFPEERVHIAFNAPFWRVRIGDYRHKHEALILWNELQSQFPTCYVVKDGDINMENL